MTDDALVLGSGPAGWAVATALAARGLRVTVCAPDPEGPWPASYGVWTDRAPEWSSGAAATTWASATVSFDRSTPPVTLERSYTRFDTGELQGRAIARAVAAGVSFTRGSVVRPPVPDATGCAVDTSAGPRRAALVIDATGAGAALDGVSAPTLFQTALGWWCELDRPLDGLRWMDFSHRFGDGTELPTFLYALPLADGRVFLEETSLAREGGVRWSLLEARLRERLAAEGIGVRAVHEVERCSIGLDRAVPPPQRVVGFGAAAGMVHPATGYSLARAFALADPVAEGIVAGLARDPAAAAHAAWQVLWPTGARARWAVYRASSRAVSRLGADDTRTFFAAFFESPAWRAWLDDELSLPALSVRMTQLFARIPAAVQRRVVWSTAPSPLQEEP